MNKSQKSQKKEKINFNNLKKIVRNNPKNIFGISIFFIVIIILSLIIITINKDKLKNGNEEGINNDNNIVQIDERDSNNNYNYEEDNKNLGIDDLDKNLDSNNNLSQNQQQSPNQKEQEAQEKINKLEESLQKIQGYNLGQKANLFCDDMYMLTDIYGNTYENEQVVQQIKQNKQTCKQIKQQAQEQLEQKENSLKQAKENFNISACKNYVQIDIKKEKQNLLTIEDLPKDWSKEQKEKEIKNMENEIESRQEELIKKCEFGYAINQDNCNLFKEDNKIKECQQIKRDIEIYRRIQKAEREYGKFNLDTFLNDKI